MEDLENLWRILQVVLGIGLVIFVHEAGHFLAARWCGVRVEVFSLGLGPRILAWRRGGTVYQIAAIPVGGYVKMAGEEGSLRGGAPRPGDLLSKTVGQRFLIYSGGVLMNVALAFVVFPILLMVGVPFTEPLLGAPEPGSPAWHAGLQEGTRVHAVNGNPVYAFMHIPNEVALGPSSGAVLSIEEPDGTRRDVTVVPRYDERNGINRIGVRQAADPSGRIEVAPDSPAAHAGVTDADRLVGLKDALPGASVATQLAWRQLEGEPVTLLLERDGAVREVSLEPERTPVEAEVLGVEPLSNHLVDLRPRPVIELLGLVADDRLVAVNGRPILRARDVLRALVAGAGEPVKMEVRRGGRTLALEGPALSRDEAGALYRDLAFASDVASGRVVVIPTSAADRAGLRDGDRVLRIDGADVADFSDLSRAVKAHRGSEEPLLLSVQRAGPDGGPEFVELAVRPGGYGAATYGLAVRTAEYVYRADDPLTAMVVGVSHSWKFVEEAYLTLKRILFGQVSGDNLGGIITIGVVSHNWAGVSLTRLFFFLCMLSMNLAFLNVLPIPVLDGGHLFFLIVEKLKGSPVSERVLGYSQMVGLVMILSLMVYVTYNDLKRWVFPD